MSESLEFDVVLETISKKIKNLSQISSCSGCPTGRMDKIRSNQIEELQKAMVVWNNYKIRSHIEALAEEIVVDEQICEILSDKIIEDTIVFLEKNLSREPAEVRSLVIKKILSIHKMFA